MTRSLYAACGAALLVGGCVLSPTEPLPPAPLPTAWSGGDVAQGVGGSLDRRVVFPDPALQTAIDQALRNNRDLRIALLRIEEARATWRIQRADRLPSVGAQAGSGRAQTPADLSGIGRDVTASQYSANLNLSWELDFWGRVRSLEAAALARYLATEAGAQGAALSLIAATAETWLQLRELDERLALADRTLATRQEAVRIARLRHARGATSRFDLIQAETLLTQVEGESLSLRLAREQAANALTLLTGAPTPSDTRSFETLDPDGPVLAVALPAGLPSDLLLARPDVRAAEHRLRAADADIAAARAALFPRIALTGLFGSASTDLDHLFDGTSNRQWNLAASVTAPVFDRGRLRANTLAARMRGEIALADYERTLQTAFRETADALAAQRVLAAQIEVRARALIAMMERSRLAELRYASGAAAYLEVLDAERDRFASEQAVISARRALLSSHVALYAALGGGDLLNDTQNLRTR
jgi:NodT family efflux transporter outer membrane factor (OMF) lipoprotein